MDAVGVSLCALLSKSRFHIVQSTQRLNIEWWQNYVAGAFFFKVCRGHVGCRTWVCYPVVSSARSGFVRAENAVLVGWWTSDHGVVDWRCCQS